MTSIPSTTPGWKNREKKNNPRETLVVGVQNPFGTTFYEGYCLLSSDCVAKDSQQKGEPKTNLINKDLPDVNCFQATISRRNHGQQ